MEHTHLHTHVHNDDHEHNSGHATFSNARRLALSATLHCLLGCGIGEVAGMAIGAAFGWDNLLQMISGIVLGFVAGFALGMLPLLKAKFSFRRAFKQVLIAEGLSIVVMETAEVITQVYTPGVMHANLTDGIFWIGMLLALIAGFLAAYPVNYYMVKKGFRHNH